MYRDDLEAAHCRIEKLEEEKGVLEVEVKKLRGGAKPKGPGKTVMLLLLGFALGLISSMIVWRINTERVARIKRSVAAAKLFSKKKDCRAKVCRELCASTRVWDYGAFGDMYESKVQYESDVAVECLCRGRDVEKTVNVFPKDMEHCEWIRN